ncbi:MAG TPA: MoaD/ThiS family protein [Flavobacteriales bacterium]|nr:MoaD/ThiS family protein [Flavobacteriales bacterium]
MDVLLFGIIAEKAGRERLAITASDTRELRARLTDAMPFLASLSYAIAVDRHLLRDDRPLNGDEEIALLPPFAGG